MKGRQVSVTIRASFDRAFKETFSSADQRISDLRESLRKLHYQSKEIDQLRSTRAEVSALSESIATKKDKLKSTEGALRIAIDAEKTFEEKVQSASIALKSQSSALSSARNSLVLKRRDISETKAKIDELKTSTELSSKYLSESKIDYDLARQGLKEYEKSLGSIKKRSGEEKASLEKLKATLSEASGAYEEARIVHHANTKALKDSHAALLSQRLALRKSKEGFLELKAALETAKSELAMASKALGDHRKKAEEAGGGVARLSQKVKEHERTLKTEEDRLIRSEEALRRYEKSLEQARIDIKDLDAAERKLGSTLDRQRLRLSELERLGRLSQQARELRSGAISDFYGTLALGGSFLAPIKVAADFEQAMVRVGAMASATKDELSLLSREARRLGAETIYSAREVAMAQNNLATAGFNPTEILRVMPSMLGLADAGMTDLATTADISAAILRGFSLDVSEMDRTADVLTAAFTASSSSLESLGETMKYVAPIASAIGASLEETSAAAALLSNVGIKGSMAGTALRAIYGRLAAPPSEARKVLGEMGIEAKDAAENLKPLPDLLNEITQALEGFGTAKRAEVIKKLAGEEAAADLTELLKQTRTGKFQAEIKRYELAPTMRQLGDRLLGLSEGEFQSLRDKYGLSINRAMTGVGLVQSLGETFSGLTGEGFERRFQVVAKDLGLAPKEADVKVSELHLGSKAAQNSLRMLGVSEIGFYGEKKRKEELTDEISAALTKLPEEDRLRHIEVLFSKTRTSIRALAAEFSAAGGKGEELVMSLERVNSVDKTRTQLSGTALKAWSDFKGDIEETGIILGNAALPMLKDLGASIKPIAEGFTRWLEGNKELTTGIMKAVGGLFAFSASMMAVKFSLSGFLMLAGGGWKILSIGLKVFDHLSNKASLFRRMISSLGGPVRMAMTAILSGLRLASAAILTTPLGWIIAGATAVAGISYLVYRNWNLIKPRLEAIWGAMKDSFSRVWEWIKKQLSWHPMIVIAKNWDKIYDYVRSLYAKVRPYIEKLLPFFSGKGLEGSEELRVRGGGSSGSSMDQSSEALPKTTSYLTRVPTDRRMVMNPSVTVNAEIYVNSSRDSPRVIAEKIKDEIKAAFTHNQVFTLFDPVGVS